MTGSIRGRFVLAAMALCALGLAPVAMAQPAAGGAGAGNGADRFTAFIKERLAVTDDEWKVLSPKLDNVRNIQRDMRGGGGFGGRRGGAPADAPTTPVAKASQELRTALDNKDTAAEDIAKKLTAYREAREKAKAALTAAQKELKEVLTARQEALLVTMGMLD